MARLQRIRIQSSAGNCSGYLTVFLSLSLTIILSLVLTLIEGARTYAVRMQAECVLRTAMDSCLAEFNRELESRYSLFMVDTTYGSGSTAASAMENHLEDYLNRNLESTSLSAILGVRDLTALSVSSCEITDTRYAADNHGRAVREQIEAYMSAGPEAALAAEFMSMFGTYEDLDEAAWQEAFDDASDEFEDALEEALEEAEDDEEELDDPEGEENLDLVTEILDEIRSFIGRAFLEQVLGGDDVSDANIEGEDLLEDRSLHQGTDYTAENSHHYSEVGSLTMGQYILEHCGNFREQIDGCALQYEVEYIVFGERSDERNMEFMSERLVLLRAAANLAVIHSIGSCTRAANAVAAVLEWFLGIPRQVTRELILVIWSYAEAIQDVRTLYKGGRVPIIKSASEWRTSLSSLCSLGDGNGVSGGSGIDYAMYLRFFLLAEDQMHPEEVTERLMNIMERDVTKAQDGSPLYMDWCLDAMRADVTFASGYGHSVRVQQEITYN